MPAIPAGTDGGVIVGWGTAVPDKVVTNDDLAAVLDTSDAWIRERTGIHERRVGGTTSGLAIEAGRAAMDKAGVDPATVDLVLLCTTTPDKTVPATSAAVQDGLGLRCGAFDLNAACSGFVYGLTVANAMVAAGSRRILLIGAETLSKIVDWDDRNTAVLFGDGAAAVVIDAADGPGQLLAWDLDADGSALSLLYSDVGGYLHMAGKEVFRRAVRIMVDSAQKSLAAAGVKIDDIAMVIPHQANFRIIDAACRQLGVPTEKAAVVLHRTGNTSAASIPLALVDALDAGRIRDGDLVLMVGFGAGMTAASAILRWGRPA